MDTISTVVSYSIKVETILKKRFGAEGHGLNELTSSIKELLPQSTIRLIRKVAYIRNKVVHDDDYQIDSLHKFINMSEQVLDDLKSLEPKLQQFSSSSSLKVHPDLGEVNTGGNSVSAKKPDENNDEEASPTPLIYYVLVGYFGYKYYSWLTESFDFTIFAIVLPIIIARCLFQPYRAVGILGGIFTNAITYCIFVYGYEYLGFIGIGIGCFFLIIMMFMESPPENNTSSVDKTPLEGTKTSDNHNPQSSN